MFETKPFARRRPLWTITLLATNNTTPYDAVLLLLLLSRRCDPTYEDGTSMIGYDAMPSRVSSLESDAVASSRRATWRRRTGADPSILLLKTV